MSVFVYTYLGCENSRLVAEGGAKMPVLCVLYADRSSESEEAEAALKAAHLDYQAVHLEDPGRDEKPVPRLLAAEGFFYGLKDILWYAHAYGNPMNGSAH